VRDGLIHGSDTSYIFSNVKDGTAYDIKVYAQNAQGSAVHWWRLTTHGSGSNVKGNIPPTLSQRVHVHQHNEQHHMELASADSRIRADGTQVVIGAGSQAITAW